MFVVGGRSAQEQRASTKYSPKWEKQGNLSLPWCSDFEIPLNRGAASSATNWTLNQFYSDA